MWSWVFWKVFVIRVALLVLSRWQSLVHIYTFSFLHHCTPTSVFVPSPQCVCQVHPVLSCSVMTLRSLFYSCSLCDSHLSHSAIPDHSLEGFCYFLILLLRLFWTSTIEGMISIGYTVISPGKMDATCIEQGWLFTMEYWGPENKVLEPYYCQTGRGKL